MSLTTDQVALRARNQRQANVNWIVGDEQTGDIKGWEGVQVAVLMDIRDELRKLNQLLHCYHFQKMPRTLEAIARRLDRRTAEGRRATQAARPAGSSKSRP